MKYLVVRQMSFDRVSNICGKVVGQISPRLEWIIAKIIQFSGCEIDSVAASKKLKQLGIQEVIVQATNKPIEPGALPKSEDFMTDGPIIATASLGYALIQQKITDNKTFHCLPNTAHMTEQAFHIIGPDLMEFSK